MAKNSIQEIASAIAAKHGLSQQDAEAFVTAFFDLINDALHDEKAVKVKGLGTFKVIDVRERESVNVNTGERVLIEGHGKITFTADPVMRDLVNKPFAQFETVVLNDGIGVEDMAKIQSDDGAELKDDGMDDAELIEAGDDIGDSGDSASVKKESDTPNAAIADYDLSHLEQSSENDKDNADDNHNQNGNEPDEADESAVHVAEVASGSVENVQDSISANDNHDEINSTSDDSNTESSLTEVDEPVKNDVVDNISNVRLDNKISDNTCVELEQNDENVSPNTEILQNKTEEQPVKQSEVDGDSADDSNEESRGNSSSIAWYYWVLIMFVVAVAAFFGGRYWEQYNAKPVIKYVTVRQSVSPANVNSGSSLVNDSANNIGGKQKEQVGDSANQKNSITEKSKNQDKANASLDKTAAESKNMRNAVTAVRTGAYRIVGTDRVVTVKKGETLKSISKFYLGDGMECYIMVHNGITDVKEGMRLKIPKLVNKRR